MHQLRKPRQVDIETEWNLKIEQVQELLGHKSVDIETEWNLKFF